MEWPLGLIFPSSVALKNIGHAWGFHTFNKLMSLTLQVTLRLISSA